MKKVFFAIGDYATQRIFTSFLSENYDVCTFSNKADAIIALENTDYAYILIDLFSPEIDGISILQYLIDIKKSDTQPISVILKKQDLQQEINLMNMGCSEIFTEPFDSIITRKRIENVIALSLLKKNVAVYEQQLITDPLTGLYNKNGFQTKVRKHLKTKKRGAFIMCDLDGLKYINDTFSHQTGDVIIEKVGKTLEAVMPEDSYISHVSGDEFCIYLKSFESKEQIATLCEKFQKQLLKKVLLPDLSRPVTTSLGIALYPESATSYEALQSKADHAMLYVKNHGKNGYKFHTPRDDREELLKGRQECTSVPKEFMLKGRAGEENQIWLKFGEFRIVYITYQQYSIKKLRAQFCLLNIVDKENPLCPNEKNVCVINEKITTFIKDAQYSGIYSWFSMNQLLILSTKKETLPQGVEHIKQELENELKALHLDIIMDNGD